MKQIKKARTILTGGNGYYYLRCVCGLQIRLLSLKSDAIDYQNHHEGTCTTPIPRKAET